MQISQKSISSLINHFKGAVKKWANKNNYKSFVWQRNYYEHVIRNEESLNQIREYVVINPYTWEKDDLFVK